jgi:hypothetical protein
MNRLRFDVWNAMRQARGGVDPAQIATFVNEATGRAKLGAFESSAVVLGRLMFSPRFFVSRVQLLLGHSLWRGNLATRGVIATEYAKMLIGLGSFYAMVNVGLSVRGKKPEIGTDPRSSDFGKIKLGNTRVDPLAGVAQVFVFLSRMGTGETTNAKGRSHAMTPDEKLATMVRFARSKANPVIGSAVNLITGSDMTGRRTDFLNEAINYAGPMTYSDVYKALEDQGVPEGAIIGLLALLGNGVQTYDANAPRPRKSSGAEQSDLKRLLDGAKEREQKRVEQVEADRKAQIGPEPKIDLTPEPKPAPEPKATRTASARPIDRSKVVNVEGTSPKGKRMSLQMPAGDALDMLTERRQKLQRIKEAIA